MSVQVLAPYANVYVPPRAITPRLDDLTGMSPGVLENTKPNAQLLMEAWIDELRGLYGLKDTVVGHKGVALPPSRQTLDLLAGSCDFVLVGTGDCGSCLAWTVRSAVKLEERKIPTVCIGTDAFEDQFRLEAENSGMPELRFVGVEHPLGGQTEVQVREKARRTTAAVLEALLTTSQGVPRPARQPRA